MIRDDNNIIKNVDKLDKVTDAMKSYKAKVITSKKI